MNSPGIAVAVRRPDGEETYVQAGQSVFEHGVPVADTTVFNVGSVAKQVTAYLAVLAHRSHILDLAAEVRNYLPRLQVSGIAVLDLVTHSAGIRDVESMLSLCGFQSSITTRPTIFSASRTGRRRDQCRRGGSCTAIRTTCCSPRSCKRRTARTSPSLPTHRSLRPSVWRALGSQLIRAKSSRSPQSPMSRLAISADEPLGRLRFLDLVPCGARAGTSCAG